MVEIKNIRYMGELSGNDSGNIDVFVELEDGRVFGFVVYTPQNILHLWQTSYSNDLEWVVFGNLIVRRIDKTCIESALKRCVESGIENFGVLQDFD